VLYSEQFPKLLVAGELSRYVASPNQGSLLKKGIPLT
jgi:hypothetical protein